MTATLTAAQFRALSTLSKCREAETTRGKSSPELALVNAGAATVLVSLGLARRVVQITHEGRRALELYPE